MCSPRASFFPGRYRYTLLVAIIGCHGCHVSSDRELRLQAVIVTKGQAVVPLALMDVHAARLASVREALKGWRTARSGEVEVIERELQLKARELAEAEAHVDSMRAAAAAVEAERRRKRDEAMRSETLQPASANPLDNALQKRRVEDAANREFRSQDRVVAESQRQVRDALARTDAIRRQMDELNGRKRETGFIDVYAALPRSSRSWRTDTSGFATIVVPSNEEWVIWAASTRRVGGSTEEYEWLLPVPLEPPDGGIFYLSGDNLLVDTTLGWLVGE